MEILRAGETRSSIPIAWKSALLILRKTAIEQRFHEGNPEACVVLDEIDEQITHLRGESSLLALLSRLIRVLETTEQNGSGLYFIAISVKNQIKSELEPKLA